MLLKNKSNSQMLQFIFISGSDFIFNFQSEANRYISAMVPQEPRICRKDDMPNDDINVYAQVTVKVV